MIICIERIASQGIFKQVDIPVMIGVKQGITSLIRIQPMGNLPGIRHAVMVGILRLWDG